MEPSGRRFWSSSNCWPAVLACALTTQRAALYAAVNVAWCRGTCGISRPMSAAFPGDVSTVAIGELISAPYREVTRQARLDAQFQPARPEAAEVLPLPRDQRRRGCQGSVGDRIGDLGQKKFGARGQCCPSEANPRFGSLRCSG